MDRHEFFKWLGEKIKEFRLKSKLTQREICAQVGIYEADLSSFENHGRKIQDAFTITQIIMATGHTWLDLFRENSEKKTVKLTLKSAASPLTPSPA